MRKVLIFIVLVIALFLCYSVVSNGLTIGSFKISNYSEVGAASKKVDTLISQLANLNGSGIENKRAEIKTAISKYQSEKGQYDSMKEVMRQELEKAEQEMSMVDMYDIDFLWTIIGNYATEEGVTIKLDLMKSAVFADITTEDYTMCDMNFTLTGDYIAITELMYDIEDDDRLGFEISNFNMVNGGENLMGTFTVKGVPVNNRTLLKVQASIDLGSVADGSGSAAENVGTSVGEALQATGDSLSKGKLRETNSSETANALDM